MKKLAVLFMSIILVLSMAACNNKTAPDQTPNGQTTNEDRISFETDDSENADTIDESNELNTSEDASGSKTTPSINENTPVQGNTPSSETETPNRPNNNGSADKPANNNTPSETDKPAGSNQGAKPNTPAVTQPNNPQPPVKEPDPNPQRPVVPTPEPKPEPTPDPIPEPPKPAEAGKTLIVYFSWSSNTERMANTIKEQTGGDLLELIPVNTYPTDYTACTEVALAERDSNARPAIQNLPSSISEYDKILIGYPIWWHTAPMIIGTFLESYDLTGIDVYPFTQSASMDRTQFNNSMEFVRECAVGATVHDGLFARYSDTAAITTYLNNNNLSK